MLLNPIKFHRHCFYISRELSNPIFKDLEATKTEISNILNFLTSKKHDDFAGESLYKALKDIYKVISKIELYRKKMKVHIEEIINDFFEITKFSKEN